MFLVVQGGTVASDTREREKEEFPDQMKGEAGREGRELVTDEQGR